jgi:hypothetical protein
MKNIILDHFRRWWWLCVAGMIGVGLIAWGISMGGTQARSLSFFPLGIWMGAFLLSFDLQRGHTRALLALPLTVRQIARGWWWASVGIPAAAIAAITLLVFTIISAFTGNWSALADSVIYCIANFFMLGTMFFALTGVPARPGGGNWIERVRRTFFGALWGISFAGFIFFKNLDMQTATGAMVLAAAAILTVLGWFRAETLVKERGGFRSAFQSPSRKNTKPSRCAEGHGGLRFFAQTIFTRMTLMGLAMFGVFILIFGLMLRGFIPPLSGHVSAKVASEKGIFDGNASMFTFQFLWVMSFQLFQFAYHIRFLRTLPFSAAKLAGVLVFTPLLAMTVVLYSANLLMAAVFQSPPLSPVEMFQQGFFLQIALATVFIPVMLWRGLDRSTYFLMIAVMIAGMFSSTFFKNALSAPTSGAISLLLIFSSFIITKLLLERSSAAYRPRTNLFVGWQYGAGR